MDTFIIHCEFGSTVMASTLAIRQIIKWHLIRRILLFSRYNYICVYNFMEPQIWVVNVCARCTMFNHTFNLESTVVSLVSLMHSPLTRLSGQMI